jgi:hypothetical protein
VNDAIENGVRAPLLAITDGRRSGKLAWWTGDLGQRANLTAGAAPELIGGAPPISPEIGSRIVSEATLALHGNPQWAKEHFHDFTAHSRSLLTDNRQGGLKKDFSVYFQSTGTIDSTDGSPGLTDTDRLAGPANEQDANAQNLRWKDNPLRRSAPRFGVLRHWAGLAASTDEPIKSIRPETLSGLEGAAQVQANQRPVKLDGSLKTSLQPVLVEASQFHSFSWFKKSTQAVVSHHLRKHLYPRIALWNPYSVPLTTQPMMVLLQINGRHDFWIDGYFPDSKGKPKFPIRSPWVAFDGGRSRDFVPVDGSLFSSPGFRDPHMGSYYYQLSATRFEPGECLVFTPARALEYRTGIHADGNETNLASNLLSTSHPPHPERCLTIHDPHGQPGFDFIPTGITMESTDSYFANFKMEGNRNPTDDLRVILKDAPDQTDIDAETFDKLPQLTFVSGSLQYGAGREPAIPWAGTLKIPIEETTNGPPKLVPDGRTRQGLRLRTGNNSPTAGKEAIFANWNPRAAFSLRSPRENFRLAEGHTEMKNAPWGFGIYERFLPTADANWSDHFPTSGNGKQQLDPLGLGRKNRSIILFDIPRKESGVGSIGQLQHAKISDFVWHPARTIGNSQADPRVNLIGTLP